MDRITTTPFGARPVTAGHLAREARLRALEICARGAGEPAGRAAGEDDFSGPAAEAAVEAGPDKWAVLKALAAGRAAFGVTDRDLAALAALLSFHPERTLAPGEGAGGAGLIVFPSNAALSARAHGMAESTLRRHLAALVAAGLIRRQDSPNGKRYAARGVDGAPERAFGFDLAPLAWRAGEIEAAATAAREAALRLKRLRETANLRLRDVVKLAAYGAEALPRALDWPLVVAEAAAARRRLRRKLDAEALAEEAHALAALLARVERALDGGITTPERTSETEEMDGNDGDFERRHQNSNPDHPDSETRLEKARKAAGGANVRTPPPVEPGRSEAEAGRDDDDAGGRRGAEDPVPSEGPPFAMVRDACPEIALYVRSGGLDGWTDLIAAADFVRPMLGISPDAWAAATTAMGRRDAAATLACILERAEAIRSPGGYLRALTAKARGPGFSPTPMVAALLNRDDGPARGSGAGRRS